MKKGKFGLLLIVAVLIVTMIVGCGGKQTSQAPGNSDSTNKGDTKPTDTAKPNDSEFSGTITMLIDAANKPGIEAVLAEYKKLHPKVNIEYIIWETVTDFETMMTNYIATNTLPDMYLSQVGVVQQQYAAEGSVTAG